MKYLTTTTAIKAILLGILLSVTLTRSWAQSYTASPYSRYGIGDLQYSGFAMNRGLGSSGFAIADSQHINITNPASLAYRTLTTFETGLLTNSVDISNAKGQSTRATNASLNYIALGYRITDRWGGSFGLLPYSRIGYNVQEQQNISGVGNVLTNFEGSGGINRIYLGNGFKIGRFSAGVNLSYLFGSMNRLRITDIPPTGSTEQGVFNVRTNSKTTVSDIYYDLGLMYNQDLGKDWSVALGAVFANSQNIRAWRGTLTETFFGSRVKDTITNTFDDRERGEILIPTRGGFGLAVRKGADWLVSMDVERQNWQDFSSFGLKDSITNSTRLAGGIRWNPSQSYQNRDVPYRNKIHYRLGASIADTYLQLKNTQIRDYGMSFGVGLPFKPGCAECGTSFLNLGIEGGKKGTVSQNLVKELYVRFTFGVTFNTLWFIRPKYD